MLRDKATLKFIDIILKFAPTAATIKLIKSGKFHLKLKSYHTKLSSENG